MASSAKELFSFMLEQPSSIKGYSSIKLKVALSDA